MIIVAFFGGYALFGQNGALAWGDYRRQLVERTQRLDRVEAERAALANRVALLDARHANPDLVDELVRKNLGVVQPNEIVVRLK